MAGKCPIFKPRHAYLIAKIPSFLVESNPDMPICQKPRFLGVESNPSLVGLDHCCRFWHYVPGEMDVNRPHVGLSSSWATLKMGVCLGRWASISVCVCVCGCASIGQPAHAVRPARVRRWRQCSKPCSVRWLAATVD